MFPDTPQAKKALDLKGIRLFLWFARFPLVLSRETKNGFHIVRLLDLRLFTVEGMFPFVYEVVLDDRGNVQAEKWG